MKKLLVVTLLVALLALSAESFRVTRQTDEEQGTLARLTEKVKSIYQGTVNTASEYLENIRGLKLEEKAKNLYTDATKIAGTYSGIIEDQIYYFFYSQQ
ncbi:apolipoprotein C-II isoform X2 [Scophthalmus maximus]|nr:apolipoprotein C-II isoform X2 [Scophthalmus maximus]